MGLRLISVKIPRLYVETLDLLVQLGIFNSRSEAIREAVRRFLHDLIWRGELAEILRDKLRDESMPQILEEIQRRLLERAEAAEARSLAGDAAVATDVSSHTRTRVYEENDAKIIVIEG